MCENKKKYLKNHLRKLTIPSTKAHNTLSEMSFKMIKAVFLLFRSPVGQKRKEAESAPGRHLKE